jgi:hypothetical protein
VAIAGLEEEIANLEAQLRSSKDSLAAASKKHYTLSNAKQSLSLRLTLKQKMASLEPKAEALARKYTSLKGLHMWKAAKLNNGELSFHFIGPSPETCVHLLFKVSGSSSVACNAYIDPSIYGRYKEEWASRRFRVVTSFLEARTLALCKEVSSKALLGASHIPDVLRDFEWQLGRLEYTASELTMLHRRYKAILAPSQIAGSSNFQMEVDFSSRSDSAKLSATFELPRAYPFAPLNVLLDTFEGRVDVEGLRRLLMKNAKPGFGYLSRTCDVIAAYVCGKSAEPT